jgi:hypothetical protein
MRDLRVCFGGGVVLTLGLIGILSASASAREIEPDKELIITDPKVVDSAMATFPGILSFGHLVSELAEDERLGKFLLDWLGQWKNSQTVNGFAVPARPAIQEKVIEPWQRKDGFNSLWV